MKKLAAGLAERGRSTWVDWQDIPPGADWMTEVESAIDSANAFLLVLSPDSTHSYICSTELLHAVHGNKRIVPVLCRDVVGSEVPDEAAKLNWILFRGDDDPGQAIDALVEALETDRDHVRAHTRLLVRATEWDQADHDRSLLLRGNELRQGEAVISSDLGLVAWFVAVQQTSTARSSGPWMRRSATSGDRPPNCLRPLATGRAAGEIRERPVGSWLARW